MEAHGGRLAAEVLLAHGVDTLFTLSGGHLFVLYDGCVQAEVALVDTRHEQTAVFAAEGWSKLTRRPGVAALTAGPGVTNGVSALTAAGMNGSPVLAIGGRAPQARWGSGSLQELDHVPIVSPVVKRAVTATSSEQIPELVHSSLVLARTPHRGPTFVDIPLDVFGPATVEIPPVDADDYQGADPDPDDLASVAARVDASERPVLIAGADVYWDHGEETLAALAEAARVPVFTNGLGRGTIPADHELAFSRARSAALKSADLVIVAGTPLDFRLGFGRFPEARVAHLSDSGEGVASHVDLAGSASGDLSSIMDGLAQRCGSGASARDAWVATLRDEERARRHDDDHVLADESEPIKPARIYGELRRRLDRDAIVIGDGGDFVSYAGRFVDTYEPGCFLDPGPFGCLGMAPGFVLAAGVARPDRQIVVLLGDGAAGFALGDFETLVRHGVDATIVIGNNGIWGLEKHPMNMLFGYDVVAELAPGIRYDRVMESLGGSGELVSRPDDIGPALDRAFETPGPSVVNVLTDPTDAYPRSSNLG